jgi:hypothetical protein
MYSPKRRLRLFRHPAWASTPTGSISFTSTTDPSGSALQFDNSTGYFDIASNTAFTVEWFQYAISNASSAPRAFAIGTYATQTFGFSMEGSDTGLGRIIYLWRPNFTNLATLTPSNLVNTWNHFAIVGNGSNIQVYRNGSNLGSTYAYTSFVSTSNLAVGNETVMTKTASFNGYITNFRWVVGTAVYSNTFTPPTKPLTAISGTKLLLLASSSNAPTADSGPGARTATTFGTIGWVSNTPFPS